MKVEEILDQLQKDEGKRRRFLKVDRAKVDNKGRTVDIAFSSETPVPQWYGIEILDHSPGCMRMDRASSGIPLLFNHDRNALLGRMSDVRCDPDKVGRAMARFGNSPTADEKMRDVQDGILTDVSVGYQVHHMEEMDPKAMSPDLMEMAAREKAPVYRITDWEPFECSLVTVPADPTVGVGRTLAPEKKDPEKAPPIDEIKPQPIQTITEVREMDPVTKTLEDHDKDVREQSERAAKAAKESAEQRVAGIYQLAKRFRQFVPDFIVEKAVSEGMPLDEFQRMVLSRVEGGKPIDTPVSELGLSNQEINRYSVSRAIMSQVPDSGVDASFEKACHQELVKRGLGSGKGILMPYDMMKKQTDPHGTGQRDLSLASSGVGGYLQGTDHLGSEFIDVLRNRLLIRKLGCRVLSGLKGNVSIPKRTVGAVSYWVADGSAPTEGANTFGTLSLTPKNVGANVDYTRQLLLQSNPSIDALVNGDLAISLATAIDLAAFEGQGTNEPSGISITASIGAFPGTSLDFAALLNAQSDVATANALSENCAYVTTPAVAALLKARAEISSTYSPLWVGNLLEGTCAGFKAFSTNQLTAASMIFGDFSQLILAEWGTLELLVDPYTQGKNGIIGVTAFQSVDVGVRYAGAFSRAVSIT